MQPCHQCQKPHDRATNDNIYCIECTGEDSFQCEDCCEIKKLSEMGWSERCKPFNKVWCKACCEKPEEDVDGWDDEPYEDPALAYDRERGEAFQDRLDMWRNEY